MFSQVPYFILVLWNQRITIDSEWSWILPTCFCTSRGIKTSFHEKRWGQVMSRTKDDTCLLFNSNSSVITSPNVDPRQTPWGVTNASLELPWVCKFKEQTSQHWCETLSEANQLPQFEGSPLRFISTFKYQNCWISVSIWWHTLEEGDKSEKFITMKDWNFVKHTAWVLTPSCVYNRDCFSKWVSNKTKLRKFQCVVQTFVLFNGKSNCGR